MPTLTVFTPAYNRAHTLTRTYESLCRQTCKDFEWLVVDDGSTDSTADLVKSWIGKAPFDIRYIYQENQGMHGAHNTAYRNIHTELNTCIDSDDWMPDDAVERIVSFWKQHGSDRYAGIIGLDTRSDGSVIGTGFPEGMTETTLDGYYRSGGKGDKKLVYRTDVINSYPEYPIFEGERYVGLSYKYLLIDQNYKLLVLDAPLVTVEYMDDGSTMNMFRQYWRNPKGWSFLRKVQMRYITSPTEMLKVNIHYVSHSIRCRNGRFLSQSPKKAYTLAALVPGVMLYLLTWYKATRKTPQPV